MRQSNMRTPLTSPQTPVPASRRLTIAHVLVPLIALAGVYAFLVAGRDSVCGTDATPQVTSLRPAKSRQHVLVTGGAGYIGSHAAMSLLREGHAVTIVDNLSRGNMGAIRVLQRLAAPQRLQFVELDLGDSRALQRVFQAANIDVVMHFAAVAYVGFGRIVSPTLSRTCASRRLAATTSSDVGVGPEARIEGESMAEPLRYYSNITSNTVNVLNAMAAHNVNQLVYSSTCATYGVPATLPVTEETPTVPVNPYGRAKLAAEQAIKDYAAANSALRVTIFRYFNVYGSDPRALLGEYPRPELRSHARISGACLDAAMKEIKSLTISGTNHPTEDGTCIRDYIHVEDLVGAHVLGMRHLKNPPALYNIGTGHGVSVREFVNACRNVTGVKIAVHEQREARPGDYPAVWADPAKIERELGWHAKYVNVEDGLRHAWTWRRRNPKGYGSSRSDAMAN